MSLRIKGMKMPKHCGFCPMFNSEDSCVLKEYLGVSDCPLSEIPTPHGRLIDADALPKKDINLANVPYNWIKVAPTIIEAEE